MSKPAKVAFEPEAQLKIKASSISPEDWSGDLLLIGVYQEDFQPADDLIAISNSQVASLNDGLHNVLGDILAFGGFEGKQGQTSQVLRVGGSKGPKLVGMLGLGQKEAAKPTSDWGPSVYQTCGAAITSAAKANKAVTAAVYFLTEVGAEAAGKVATGVLLAAFEPTRFKSKVKDKMKLEGVELLGVGGEGVEEAIKRAEVVTAGNLMTRYLVEAPPNVCTPTHLAECSEYLAAKYPSVLKLEVLEKAQCQELGMGCYLGVAECSEEPPKFIHLTYTPPGGATKKVALVGKGITFDSGGYNLKVHGMIELMKFDMGGAGAVLGAANIIGALQPAGVEVHFIIAACENMVDGKGTRPGDILTSAAGKTVEINNTDAEGRLTLADAVWFAQAKAGATTVVDIATLTGAAMIALGLDIAALYSSKDELAEQLLAASKSAGEKLWRMPLETSYFDSLKSSSADMKNHGSRWGGSIVAATFIKEFIEEGVDWAHLDVAGPVWDEKLGLPTGYGAATLAAWVESLGA